jgi:DNA-directed RNA polymerase beta' subunit
MQQEVTTLEHAQSIATAHQETVSLARLLEEQQSAQERNQRVDQLYREQQERLKETVEKLTREVRSDVRKESREQLRTVADVFVREVRRGRGATTQKVSGWEERWLLSILMPPLRRLGPFCVFCTDLL